MLKRIDLSFCFGIFWLYEGEGKLQGWAEIPQSIRVLLWYKKHMDKLGQAWSSHEVNK